MNKVKWSDAVKAFGKGRLKKGTTDYDECKKLFETMKQESKKEIIVEEVKEVVEEVKEIVEEKKDCVEKKNRKSVIELLKFLKDNKN